MDPSESLSFSDCLENALKRSLRPSHLPLGTGMLTPTQQQWDGNIIQTSGQYQIPGIEWIGGAQAPVGLRTTQTPGNQGYEDFNGQPGSPAVTSESWAANNAQASAEARSPSAPMGLSFPRNSEQLKPRRNAAEQANASEQANIEEGGFVMHHHFPIDVDGKTVMGGGFVMHHHYIPIDVDGRTVMVRKKDHWVNVSNILRIRFKWRSQYAPLMNDLKSRYDFEIIHGEASSTYGTYFPLEVGLELCRTYRFQKLETHLMALKNHKPEPDSSHPAYSGAGPTILETSPEASDHNTQGGISQVPDNHGNSSWTFTKPSFTYW
jgi:hypothetical protein